MYKRQAGDRSPDPTARWDWDGFLSTWFELGLGAEAEFWTLTPRLFAAATRGRAKAQDNEHIGRAWLAWHIEALQRTEKLPNLADLAGREAKPKPAKSPDDLLKVAMAWDRALNAGQTLAPS